ncbi:uncharacterized protein LOC132903950 [Amyelois transitella]|uniref:uncharacterized protein LOC132903950 n=1 Tax=Amyelois transitella TaxID=680683 RepID=UPI00067BB29D|nr:uncharacterized protein LOC132903950 [Amyelois transitella]
MSTSNIYPNSSTVEYITTRRGGVSILHEGRRYHRKKIYKNGDSFYKCYVKNGCRGNLTINARNEIIKITKEHDADCEADIGKNLILKKMDDLKQRSSCNFISIQKQYEDVVKGLKNDGFQFINKIPQFNNIKTGLYNERNKVLGVAKSRFNNCHDFIVPTKYKNFCVADYVDDDKRIIVFCSNENRKEMNKYHHFYADGTFKCCPKGFYQLYSIHGYNKNNNSVAPLIFALLPDKKTETYKVLFSLIKTSIGWNPQKITLDFEVAAINAIKKVFPKIIFKGCYFHFNRCLWKKAKALNVKLRTEKRHVARCVGLARLPVQYIEKGYEYVMSKNPRNPSDGLQKFNKYFNKQWIKKNEMMMSCSCGNENIRTNNSLEGWHAKINRYIGRKYPTLPQLLDILSTEYKSYDLNIKSKKNKEYKAIDEEIDQALSELVEKKISVGHCLEIISPFAISF